jgi:regulator of sigma E protease
VDDFEDVIMGIVFGSDQTADGRRLSQVTVERNGALLTKPVYPELAGNDGLRSIGISPRADLVVDKLLPDLPAAKSGLQSGDAILAVDGIPLGNPSQLKAYFQTKYDTPATLTYKRGGTTGTVSVQPQPETNAKGETVLYARAANLPKDTPNYRIGIQWKFDMVEVHQTPFDQVGRIVRQSYLTILSLINRKSDIGVRHMSGMVGMADNLQQAASVGIIPTLAFLVIINVSLAIFNLLPIPVLDGGHIVIATLTKIRRRAPSPALIQRTFTACFFLLIGLIVYVTYHDIVRVVQNRMDDSPPAAPAKAGEPGKKSPDKPGEPVTPPVVIPLK